MAVLQNDRVSTTESGQACSKHHRGTNIEYHAGIDASLESSCICVVDGNGRIVREGKACSDPEALIAWFRELGLVLARIGLEAGRLRGGCAALG